NPHDAKALSAQADSLMAHGDREHAIATYGRAIAIDPKLVTAYVNRGPAYMGDFAWEKAIADFTTVLGIGAGTYQAAAYLNRGQSFQAKGERDHAIADYDQVIQLE